MYCWIKQFGDALHDQFSEFAPTKTTAWAPNTSVKLCPQNLCSIPEQECQPSPGLQPPGLQGCWGPPRLTTQAASSAQPARAGAAGLSPASSHLSGILTRHCEQIPFAWDLSTSEAKESRDGSDQSCLWFIQEQLFSVALEIAVSSPSPGTFIEPGWSNSILAQQTPRSTLPSSQQLKEKTTGGHFGLWLQVLCIPLSNQHYWFSLAWTTKLISKQQANSGRKRGKEEGLFTLLLLQGADVLDKQCMTQVKSTGQRTGGISWCQRYPGMTSDKSNVPLHWRRSQKSHADDFVSKSRIQYTPQPVTCFPDSSSEGLSRNKLL